MTRFLRRRRFVNDRLQLKLLAINLGYLSAIIFFFLVAVFTPVTVTLYTDPSTEATVQAGSEFMSLHESIWPAIPLALALITIHSILISHRIAGPLLRFRRVFDAVGRADLSVRAGVRKNDYLQREADAINAMIDGLVGGVAATEQALGRVRDDFERLRADGGSLRELGQSLDVLESHLRRFRIPPEACSDRSETHGVAAPAEETADWVR